jgi:hypothetical protein
VPKLGILAAGMLATAIGCGGWGALAADAVLPAGAPPAVADPFRLRAPSVSDFIGTNCPLTWHGITLYGTVDAGAGWQSHGARGTRDRLSGLRISSRNKTGRRFGASRLTA